jgi:hypothetical protein
VLLNLKSAEDIRKMTKMQKIFQCNGLENTKKNCLIVGDLSNINEENHRAMSYEEVSNLFEGYLYIEINLTTGFNLDHF